MVITIGILLVVQGALLVQWGVATARIRIFTLLAMLSMAGIFIRLGISFIVPEATVSNLELVLLQIINTVLLTLAALVEREIVMNNPERRIRVISTLPSWGLFLLTAGFLLIFLWLLGVHMGVRV